MIDSRHSPAVVSKKAAASSPGQFRLILLLLIVVGLALRVVWPTVSVFCRDQARACALAQDIAAGHWQTGGLVNSGGFRNPPGFVYIMAGVWALFPTPAALMVFTSLLNVAAMGLAYFLTRRWFGASAALWSAALFATAPWAIHYCRWIWAQHLLFPAAILVFACLGVWLFEGKRWGAMGVVLGMALLVQIHLAGVVLAIALILVAVWCRPAIPWRWVIPATCLAAASFLPWLLSGHLNAPESSRTGYVHFWRAIPAALMSVCGAAWQLEFREGYSRFVQWMGWRRLIYHVANGVSLLIFAIGLAGAIRTLWRIRHDPKPTRQSPQALLSALLVAIPLAFMLAGIRTSPTYFPMWYPLPFIAMAWGFLRLQRWLSDRRPRLATACSGLLVLAMTVHCVFFIDQLQYMRRMGGVPGSPLGRSYAGFVMDLRDIEGKTGDGVYFIYLGESPIQDEAATYLLRQQPWREGGKGVTTLSLGWHAQRDGYQMHTAWSYGPDRPGTEGTLIAPWHGPQQVDGRISCDGVTTPAHD